MNNELLRRIYLLEEPEIGVENTDCIVEPEEPELPEDIEDFIDEEPEEDYD